MDQADAVGTGLSNQSKPNGGTKANSRDDINNQSNISDSSSNNKNSKRPKSK
jgi:hypothetical protein